MIQTKRSPDRNLFNYAWSYNVSLIVAKLLPLCVMRLIARIIARIWHLIDKNTRTQVESNLLRVIGNNPPQLRKTSKELFINYGTYLADWAKLSSLDTSKAVSFFGKIEGEDVFKKMYAKGKGIIILAAHLGNWELGGLIFTNLGLPFNIITSKDRVKTIAQARTKVRSLHNIRTITIEDGSFFFIDIINALKRNELVAMLVDRYEKESGILVDFFGEKTYFPRGPVLLARTTGASVHPAFTVLGPDKKYRTVLGSPISMELTEDRDRDMRVNVAKIAHAFEQYIRLYPNQWFNFSAIWDK